MNLDDTVVDVVAEPSGLGAMVGGYLGDAAAVAASLYGAGRAVIEFHRGRG